MSDTNNQPLAAATASSSSRPLPFAATNSKHVLASAELGSSLRVRGSLKPRRPRSGSGSYLASSFGVRNPTRSYFHHASHGNQDAIQYSSLGVREQTQELASWALGESPRTQPHGPPLTKQVSTSESESESDFPRRRSEAHFNDGRGSVDSVRPEIIKEEDEDDDDDMPTPHLSALSDLFRPKEQHHPPRPSFNSKSSFGSKHRAVRPNLPIGPEIAVEDVEDDDEMDESTSLLHPNQRRDTESGTAHGKPEIQGSWDTFQHSILNKWETIKHPNAWDTRQIIHSGVGMVSAVSLGLLLNVLDALSYGMILFPLGEQIFAKTGPDGISMFYVSCIVSQLTYSLGGSGFPGGVGSEMIEVVPFFHKIAFLIITHMGTDDAESVMSTVIFSYALSSILTGVIFLLLGALKLGNLVSFFPRSILLGCIGGVGVFLFLTALEVSAGLDDSIMWDTDTLKRLLASDTFFFWLIPLVLSMALLYVRTRINHPIVMPAFFILVTAFFYAICWALSNVHLDNLRDKGWVFAAPQTGVPFYNFYSYYKFGKVSWGAIWQTIPTMFALSFFGIIHVPINVPALGIAVKKEDVHINRELFAHGVSNALSGLVGSIQNYLVFANSRLFIQNGGDSRIAGVLLAAATAGVWIAGPAMIGYIPVMIVGTLIFMLGIEMVQESLWDTLGKIKTLEYLMVLAITLVMGFHDFVAGIVLGIFLACLIFVVQTSTVSSIRGLYSGTMVESTVRRHPTHRRFLHEVGGQIKIVKLSGYLFFGSIVAVEKQVKKLIATESFSKQPIRYLIIDFLHVGGLDFSAAEAFVRMHRMLKSKDVEMILTGITFDDNIGESLIMVGLLEVEEGDWSDSKPARVFEDINQALEACENELLISFKQRMERITRTRDGNLGIPRPQIKRNKFSSDEVINSPRQNQVAVATSTALREHDISLPAPWASFAQPLPLILQTLKDGTNKDFEFWRRAVPYFTRQSLKAGEILFRRAETSQGLYLLEEGILRADHELEQGRYTESIVPGTLIGEMPFFGDGTHNATIVAEKDSVLWVLDRANWAMLEKELPDLAMEMLRVSLKLTSEQMNRITSYVFVTAS